MSDKPRILCIDDQVDNLRIRAQLLEQFGCEVITVQDHLSALRVASEQDPALLVIDYHLANGETGEQIARDVRVLRPDIPLIMLTGDINLPESARNSVDEVIIKGVSKPGTLLDSIQRLLPNAKLRSRRQVTVPQPRSS